MEEDAQRNVVVLLRFPWVCGTVPVLSRLVKLSLHPARPEPEFHREGPALSPAGHR
jgi:hypothetical protein